MQLHGKTQGILGFAILFVERGLDLAGITNQQAAYFLWLCAGGLVFWAVYLNKEEFSRVHLRLPFRLPFFFYDKKDLPVEHEEYISLSEAARIAYEQLREAGNSRHVDFVGDSPEEKILEYFSIAIRLVTDIYGKHPPSTKLERIDPDVFKRGMITDGGESFKYYNDANIFYKDLSIKSSELAKTIQELKEQDKRLNNDTWTSIIEAVEYISKHIGMSATNEVDSGNIFLETLNQIRQAGHEDAIKIRGNKEVNRGMPGSNYNSLKTTIRAEYWENMEINPVCIDPDAQEEPQTEPSVLSDYNAQSQPKYFHLEIKRQDMLNRWNQSAIKGRGTML